MSEMIERVAMAIQLAAPYLRKELAERAARVAIEAMREPTDQAILEGAKAAVDQIYHKIYSWDRGQVNPADQQDWLNGAKYGYQAMIDEALR